MRLFCYCRITVTVLGPAAFDSCCDPPESTGARSVYPEVGGIMLGTCARQLAQQLVAQVELTVAVLGLLLETSGEPAVHKLRELLQQCGVEGSGAQIPVWVLQQHLVGARSYSLVRLGFRFLQQLAVDNNKGKEALAAQCWFLQVHQQAAKCSRC